MCDRPANDAPRRGNRLKTNDDAAAFPSSVMRAVRAACRLGRAEKHWPEALLSVSCDQHLDLWHDVRGLRLDRKRQFGGRRIVVPPCENIWTITVVWVRLWPLPKHGDCIGATWHPIPELARGHDEGPRFIDPPLRSDAWGRDAADRMKHHEGIRRRAIVPVHDPTLHGELGSLTRATRTHHHDRGHAAPLENSTQMDVRTFRNPHGRRLPPNNHPAHPAFMTATGYSPGTNSLFAAVVNAARTPMSIEAAMTRVDPSVKEELARPGWNA